LCGGGELGGGDKGRQRGELDEQRRGGRVRQEWGPSDSELGRRVGKRRAQKKKI